jgi:glycosyltransferase involved in cell wall biosynthesis
MRTLIAMPVFNEQKYVTRVLDEVRRYADEVLVIDDGSSDETPNLLAKQPVDVIRHAQNRGYGQSLIDAFRWASCYKYDWLITMDCDEQHEPAALPSFYQAINNNDADVISGSRYLQRDVVFANGDITSDGVIDSTEQDSPPADRREINQHVTAMINDALGLQLTDAFCGYKAYRVSAIRKLQLEETGYAFPLQFWAQAAAHSLKISELPVKLIYNDPNRSFGGPLDDPEHRIQHYREVFDKEMEKVGGKLNVGVESTLQ